MFGWTCVAIVSVLLIFKSGTVLQNKNKHVGSGEAMKQAHLKQNNLTSLVPGPQNRRAARLLFKSQGNYGFNLPQELGQHLHWTGNGNFSDSHNCEDIAHPQLSYTCTPDALMQNSFGACFVKSGEGYRIPRSMYRSSPFTCKKRMCTITATFSLSNTIPFNNLLPKNVLEIIKPTNVLELAYPTNKTTLTISQPFLGPGTRVILLKPIFWLVKGMYLPTVPLGFPESNSTYVSAQFLMLVNGRIDAIYALHTPIQATTIP
ncbi:hypothetical protein DSO57_1020062 [Entomophthora muscae]|uniref:Uncharacterized protein n=1 Tax=Entomophthora muscae TaxID=34485 RepID=A0ACC2TRT9_9FUNG|nr:hypothetical protein DSO57_1020062 [Entomophthora muscae]